VIADRIGTTVEFIPQLFGANRRPTGQRGVFMWFRTGSDSVADNAFRVLNVATTA
jgi:predicted phage gp36 major capsid-like protein